MALRGASSSLAVFVLRVDRLSMWKSTVRMLLTMSIILQRIHTLTSCVESTLCRRIDGSAQWERVVIGGTYQASPRWCHSATVINGKVIVYGGLGNGEACSCMHALQDIGTSCPSWSAVRSVGDVPLLGRAFHSAAVLNETQWLIFGGLGGGGQSFSELFLLEDITAEEHAIPLVLNQHEKVVIRWSLLSGVTQSRAGHSASLLGSNNSRLLVVNGGCSRATNGGDIFLADTAAYDLARRCWHQLLPTQCSTSFFHTRSSSPTHSRKRHRVPGRRCAGAVQFATDRMLVVGGAARAARSGDVEYHSSIYCLSVTKQGGASVAVHGDRESVSGERTAPPKRRPLTPEVRSAEATIHEEVQQKMYEEVQQKMDPRHEYDVRVEELPAVATTSSVLPQKHGAVSHKACNGAPDTASCPRGHALLAGIQC
jgi:hypothetical protein